MKIENAYFINGTAIAGKSAMVKWKAPLWGGIIPVIWQHRIMEDYIKAFINEGFAIVDINEPRPGDKYAKLSVQMAWLQKILLYLYWELRKQ